MQDPIYFPSTDKLEEYFDTVLQIHSTGQWNQWRFHWKRPGNVVWFGDSDPDEPTPIRLPPIEYLPQLTQNIEPTDTENLRLLCHLLVDWLPSQTLYEIIKVVANYLANKPSSTETYDELSSGTEGSHQRLFKLAEQFEQERYHLSPDEEAAFLDEEYLEWLENN